MNEMNEKIEKDEPEEQNVIPFKRLLDRNSLGP